MPDTPTTQSDPRPTTPKAAAEPGPRACPYCRRRRRRAWLTLGLALATAAVVVAARRPLLVAFAYAFRVEDPAPSDAMVVLLGGTPERPTKAIELYKQGLAPVVLVCRQQHDPAVPIDVADTIKDYMVSEGVPAGAVVILPGEIGSTRQEALLVRDYIDRHPARRIMVVTTAYHTARARWIFRRVLEGSGVDVRTAAAIAPTFNETDWYRSEAGLVMYCNELIKTVFYRLNY